MKSVEKFLDKWVPRVFYAAAAAAGVLLIVKVAISTFAPG